MDAAEVEEMCAFVSYCQKNPSVLHDPSLWFFRYYLESLGAQIPANPIRNRYLHDCHMHDMWMERGMKMDAAQVDAAQVDAAQVARLRTFINYCRFCPSVLHDPSLELFRHYLKSFGAQIPLLASKSHVRCERCDVPNPESTDTKKPKQNTEDGFDEEIVESEAKLVEPHNDFPHKAGDPSIEITKEIHDTAQMSKAKALDAISEGKFEEAIGYLTEAITLNPISAILYATRASVFVKMRKPDAAIQDADAALLINSDSAKGYKYRGMAKALLGNWEEAASDLHIASKLHHDEEIQSVLKMVEPNLQKIKERHREYELLKKEMEQRKSERQRWPADAADPKVESEHLSVLQDGQVQSIHSLTELETKLKAATKLSRLAILYFTAAWSGPCRSVAPACKSSAEQHPKAVFLKIDVDEVHIAVHRWNVSSVPSFLFVKDGKEIDKVVGADKSGLERKIALHSIEEWRI